jgi:hypothetical protein
MRFILDGIFPFTQAGSGWLQALVAFKRALSLNPGSKELSNRVRNLQRRLHTAEKLLKVWCGMMIFRSMHNTHRTKLLR